MQLSLDIKNNMVNILVNILVVLILQYIQNQVNETTKL